MFLHKPAADADQNRRLASAAMGRLKKRLGKGGDCHQSVGFRPKLSPRAGVQKCGGCGMRLDPGTGKCRGRCSIASAPRLLRLQHLSQFHFVSRQTWHARVKRRWAAETCGQQEFEWWTGLALADPGGRRQLGVDGAQFGAGEKRACSSSATSDQSRDGIIDAHDPTLGFSRAGR